MTTWEQQTVREVGDAYRALVTLKRRALATMDGEILSAVTALEVVVGAIAPRDLSESRGPFRMGS
jgi:hypothetical protein